MRRVAVHALVLLALGSAVAFACAGPKAGEAVFTDGNSTPSKTTSSSGSKGDDDDSTSTSSTSGGGTDAFFKTAFAFTSPGQKANDNAAHGGQPLEGDGTATTGPKNCITAGCHEGGASPWSAGGSVFAESTGGKVAATDKFEIGINKPDGTPFASAYADEQGNFWFDAPGPIPDGSTVAIRREGGKSQAMATKLTAANKGGGCNNATGCHGSSGLRIYAPK